MPFGIVAVANGSSSSSSSSSSSRRRRSSCCCSRSSCSSSRRRRRPEGGGGGGGGGGKKKEKCLTTTFLRASWERQCDRARDGERLDAAAALVFSCRRAMTFWSFPWWLLRRWSHCEYHRTTNEELR